MFHIIWFYPRLTVLELGYTTTSIFEDVFPEREPEEMGGGEADLSDRRELETADRVGDT